MRRFSFPENSFNQKNKDIKFKKNLDFQENSSHAKLSQTRHCLNNHLLPMHVLVKQQTLYSYI